MDVARRDTITEVVDWIRRRAGSAYPERVGKLHDIADDIEREFIDREPRTASCPDCVDGWRVLNPEWPLGTKPYREMCGTCSGEGRLPQNEL